MKKQLQKVLMLGMLFLYGNTFAQLNDSEKIKDDKLTTKTYFDLVLNVVGTNINYGKSNKSLVDYKKSMLGVQAGASFQAGITPKFSLVTELYFIMKGGKLNDNNPLTASKTSLRFYALELPILSRFHIGKFYVNAGPSLAYNLYGTRKMEGLSTTLTFNNSSEGFRRLDAGIQLGAGYRFKVKQKSVVLDIRYTNGLTNISHDQEMYNRYLNINVNISKP